MTDANAEQMLLDSKLVGCMIRGLPSSVLNQDKKRFKYINCLHREYSTNCHNINSVIFNISIYGKYSHMFEFPNLVCEKEAIEKVEEYLSEPLTEEYYNIIVDDLFHELPWEKAKMCFIVRGDCLTDCKFLEYTKVIDGKLTFTMGS